MQTLTDALLALFLALGSAWFAVDLVRKLRAGDAAPGGFGNDQGTRESAPAPVAPAPASLPVAPAAPAAPAPAPVAATEDALPVPHLVAITAAVHHLFKGRARLVSALAAPAMPAANPAAHAAIDWAREGRRDIFVSHRVR